MQSHLARNIDEAIDEMIFYNRTALHPSLDPFWWYFEDASDTMW